MDGIGDAVGAAVDVAFAAMRTEIDGARLRRALAIVKAELLGHDAERVGRYELRGVLGRGAMGTVYQAWDPQLERIVALKLIVGRSDEADLRRQWLREGQALATVDNPHVVEVLDAGLVADGVYLAMTRVPGITVSRWLAQGARTRREIEDVFRQAACGLLAAHARGIVHRDFKPDNVLVDGAGHVVLVDFGLARSPPATDEGSPPPRLPQTSASGTPGYAAPEQARGARAEARSDQFSFCVTLHEALTGRRPVASGTPDRSLPPRLRRLLARGLAVDPAMRWPDLSIFVARLGARGSRRWVLVGAAVLAVAIVSGGVASTGLAPGREVVDGDVAWWAPDPVPDPRVARVLAEARHATRAGRFARALATLRLLDLARLTDSQRGQALALRAKSASRQGRIEEAVADGHAAVLAASAAHDLDTELEAQLGLALNIGVEQHDEVEALRVLRSAEATIARRGDDPRDRAELFRIRAMIRQAAGEHEAAAAEIRQAIALQGDAVDERSGRVWQVLGSIQRHLGQFPESLASHDEALRGLERSLGAGHPSVAVTLVSRASALRFMGRPHAAVAQLADGLARLEAHFGFDHASLAIPLLNYGNALRDAGASSEAIAAHERYRRIVARDFGADHHAQVHAAITVAETCMLAKDWSSALEAATRAAVDAEQLLGGAHARTAYAYGLVGQVLGATGDGEGARRKSARALTIAEAALGADHPGLAYYLLGASDAARQTGEVAAARRLARRAELVATDEQTRPSVREHLEQLRDALGGFDADRSPADG